MSIGFNINAVDVPNREALVTWHAQAKPAWTLVMDGAGLCDDIHAASPATNIIHRDYASYDWDKHGDDNLADKIGAVEWINQQHAKLQGRYWAYAGNEQGYDRKTLDWTLAVVKEAIRIKQPVVIFNFGVGKPENVDTWHEAHDVLKLACENHEYIVVAVHEYFNSVPTSGFVGGAPNGLDKDGNEIHPDWTRPEDWPVTYNEHVMLWHCGRFRKMLDYCKAQGWQAPRVVITEHGADGVNDIKWWTDTLPRTPDFENIRGWRSLREYWKTLDNELGMGDFYADALIYLDRNVYKPSGIEAQLVFSWTNNSQWKPDFDVSGDGYLLDQLRRYNTGNTPPATPAPPPAEPPAPPVVTVPEHPGMPVELTNTFTSGIIMRHEPAGKQVYLIPPGAKYTYYPQTETTNAAYMWYYVEVGTAQGWVRKDAMGLDDAPDVPQEPAPDMATLAEEINRLKIENGILKERLDRIENQTDNIVTAAIALAELLKKV